MRALFIKKSKNIELTYLDISSDMRYTIDVC